MPGDHPHFRAGCVFRGIGEETFEHLGDLTRSAEGSGRALGPEDDALAGGAMEGDRRCEDGFDIEDFDTRGGRRLVDERAQPPDLGDQRRAQRRLRSLRCLGTARAPRGDAAFDRDHRGAHLVEPIRERFLDALVVRRFALALHLFAQCARAMVHRGTHESTERADAREASRAEIEPVVGQRTAGCMTDSERYEFGEPERNGDGDDPPRAGVPPTPTLERGRGEREEHPTAADDGERDTSALR